MQESKAIRKFRRSNYLANKLDCYTFYNEIYKMLDEDNQVKAGSFFQKNWHKRRERI